MLDFQWAILSLACINIVLVFLILFFSIEFSEVAKGCVVILVFPCSFWLYFLDCPFVTWDVMRRGLYKKSWFDYFWLSGYASVDAVAGVESSNLYVCFAFKWVLLEVVGLILSNYCLLISVWVLCHCLSLLARSLCWITFVAYNLIAFFKNIFIFIFLLALKKALSYSGVSFCTLWIKCIVDLNANLLAEWNLLVVPYNSVGGAEGG